MLEYLLAHIAIPFAAGVVVLAIEVVSSPKRIDWMVANDGALDMTILSIGATGGLFLNHQLQVHWGGKTPLLGILAVLANLLLSCSWCTGNDGSQKMTSHLASETCCLTLPL